MTDLTRRSVVAGGASLLTLCAGGPAFAQAKQKLRFSSAFTETDLRAEAYKSFAAAIKDDFDFEPYWGNTLFKQGTELVALQRDNLDLGNLAPADISDQLPAWSILTSAYLFRDADHLTTPFKSDLGKRMKKMAKDELGIQIIGPVFFGTRRSASSRRRRSAPRRTWPALSSGCPAANPGSSWVTYWEPIPTPMAYAELYTGLQSGTIDGQDNPVVASN